MHACMHACTDAHAYAEREVFRVVGVRNTFAALKAYCGLDISESCYHCIDTFNPYPQGKPPKPFNPLGTLYML